MAVACTVLGSRGFVGSHLVSHLQSLPGVEVLTDSTGEALPRHLGHLFYCIGVTTDFRNSLHGTMHAHVGKVMDVFKSHSFDSFTYLSSTRVYENGSSGEEAASLTTAPSRLNDFYKISKIAGEALCLTHSGSTVRVVRLSNVLGLELPPLTFVPSIICDALKAGRIDLETALESAKDYIAMEDVVTMLPEIAFKGEQRLYNLASGGQTTHEQITTEICNALGVSLHVKKDAPRSHFPDASIARLQREFGFQPQEVLPLVRRLCVQYQEFQREKRGL